MNACFCILPHFFLYIPDVLGFLKEAENRIAVEVSEEKDEYHTLLKTGQ